MNKIRIFAFLVLALFLFQTTVFAWGDTGHMTVAQIAFNNLDTQAKKNRAKQLARLIRLDTGRYEFVTSGCWMDDIRSFPMFEPIKDWHFITQMLIVNNAVPRRDPPPVNAVEVIKFLGGKLAGRDEDLKKAFYLAELIHLVGDIHQPLHTATRFTPGRPGGDTGGNLFFLAASAPRPNLHSYWDAAGGLFAFKDLGHPLTTADRTRLINFANGITTEFPKSSMTSEINQLDPAVWAREGFDIVEDDVYEGITENGVPNSAYQTKTQRISKRRIALAGYRLAAALNRVL